MFYEPFTNPANRSGWIEVITGSMFSGKTEELIRRLNRAGYANQCVEIYHTKIDTRSGNNQILSHSSKSLTSVAVSSSTDILALTKFPDVTGIDEGQFFDEHLPEVCNTLAGKGVRVIVAGLDMDFRGKPFGPMPRLMSIAENVTKVHAVCMRCGNPALYSFRKTKISEQILVGASELYEPLCRKCYQIANPDQYDKN